MRRQPILRNLDAIGEAGGDHPPANGALQRPEPEDEPEPRLQARRHPAAPEEPEKRQQERDADEPANEPVHPLPPIDRLELIEAHAAIELAVLRDGLVFLEFGLPLGLAERRQRAHDRPPFGDREPGFGEPRRAADEHHEEDERSDGIKPQPDRPHVRVVAGAHDRSLVREARTI